MVSEPSKFQIGAGAPDLPPTVKVDEPVTQVSGGRGPGISLWRSNFAVRFRPMVQLLFWNLESVVETVWPAIRVIRTLDASTCAMFRPGTRT